MKRSAVGGLFVIAGVACVATEAAGPPPFDAEQELGRWVAVWQTYDADAARDLFVRDQRLTYFSSEREGLLMGPDSVDAHYESMGFVPGGSPPSAELWVEHVESSPYGSAAVVSAVWFFGDRTDRNAAQRGPMTAVYVWNDDAYRIAHMHFANY